MRNIRFRGWHAPLNRMFSPEEMEEDQLTLLTTGSFIDVNGASTKLSTIYPTDKFIPMQFTGLHDKNGKEIFEGDLIKSLNITMYGGIREIQWDDQICAWVGAQKLVKPILLYDFVNPEVIGNIYEHPNLMKQ